MKRSLIAASLVLCVSASFGQDKTQSTPKPADELSARIEQEELAVEDYKNLPLVVIGDNALGLTKIRLQTRVELKVRAAGLTPKAFLPDSHGYLGVQTDIVGGAFRIQVRYYRYVTWLTPKSDKWTNRTMAPTWSEGTFGSHGQDVSYVLNALDEVIDEFLNAYLKANQ